MDPRILLAFFSGLFLLVLGVLARGGVWRRWESWWRGDMPFYLRNGWAGLLPLGVTSLLVAAGGLLLKQPPGPALALAGVGSLLGLFATALMMFRPPEWIKPSWMRMEESMKSRTSPHGTFDIVALGALAISSLGAIVLLFLMVVS